MATAQKIIEMAQSQLGVSETSTNYIEKYHKEFYGSATPAQWCCIFVWWVFNQCGASNLFCNGNKIDSCPDVPGYYNDTQKFKKDPKPGDIVLFDSDGSGIPDHIAIVSAVQDSNNFTSIDGNHSDKVAEVNRKTSSAWLFIRPNYDPSPSDTNITTIKNTYNIPHFDNACTMWNYFIGTGLSENAVSGLMGNIWVESSFYPSAKINSTEQEGKVYSNKVSNGSISENTFATDKVDYGLAQWAYHTRKRALYNYMKENTNPFKIDNFNAQLNYLLHDLKTYTEFTPGTSPFGILSNPNISIEDACLEIQNKFERPGKPNQASRLKHANEIYNTFHGVRNVSGNQEVQTVPQIEIVKHNNPQYCTSTPNRTIKYIVVHYTTSTHSKLGKALDICKGWDKEKQGSADFVVDNATIVQYSPDILNYRCHHCGDTPTSTTGGATLSNICTNSNSIGVELCSSTYSGQWYEISDNQSDWYFTEAVLDLGAKLIKKLMIEHNISIDNVIRHYDVSGKLCPGLVGWNKYNGNTEEKWLEFKTKINNTGVGLRSGNGKCIAKVIKDTFGYNEASETSTKVATLYVGNTVVVRQINEGWAFTDQGWIKTDALEITGDIGAMNNYLATYWDEIVYFSDGTCYAPVRRVGVNGEQIQFFDDILKTSFDSRQKLEETFTYDVYITNNELALQWLEAFEQAQGDKEVFLTNVKEGLKNTLQNKKKLIASPKKPSISVEAKENSALDITEDNIIKKLESEKKEIIKYYRQDYNSIGWNKMIEENPQNLNFWFDFLDTQGDLEQFNIQTIGSRPKAINDDKIKSIYFQETPTVLFLNPEQYSEYIKEPWKYKDLTGYTIVRIQPFMENYFTISGQGKSAKDEVDSLLYQHTYAAETATLTTVPMYHLQPNTRIFIKDDNTGVHGEYIISKITIPLQYNGTSSITATKAVERIY